MDPVDHGRAAGDSPAAAAAPLRRIVVLDGATLNPGDNPWDEIAALGALEVHDRTPASLAAARARGADAVLTNKTVLDAAFFAACPGLRVVCVLASGVNVLDVAAAAAHGVTVCNAPGYSTDSVAQHVFALVLAATNAVADHDAAVKAGRWSESPDFSFWLRPPVELAGRTMGLVGHGQIGSRVGRIAAAFGMKVLAFARRRRGGGDYAGFSWATIDEVFARSDVVSLHCPLDDGNRGFVGAALLATMREGSILVNTARGGLVDEAALVRALDAGRPAAAAVDVAGEEPPARDQPLLAHPRCIATPHMAWATLAARRRLMEITRDNLQAFASGRPRNVVG